MIKKGTWKYIEKYVVDLAYMKYKTFHFAELLISLIEFYQWDWKSNTQKHGWNIEYI